MRDKVEYLITVQLENPLSDKLEWLMALKLIGDSLVSEEIMLTKENLAFSKQIPAANTTNGKAYLNLFKIRSIDVGKVKLFYNS